MGQRESRLRGCVAKPPVWETVSSEEFYSPRQQDRTQHYVLLFYSETVGATFLKCCGLSTLLQGANRKI